MDVATETMELFKRHHSRLSQQRQQQPDSSSHGSGIDVAVTVLTQAHWPTQTLLQLNLPSVSQRHPSICCKEVIDVCRLMLVQCRH